MLNTPSTAPAVQPGPALLRDINTLVSGWDLSRSAAELIAAITERFQSELPGAETAADNTKIGSKKRGKCMSRRPGQDGSKEYIEGGWYKFRLWVDTPGQEDRRHMAIKICPVKGPGALNASQRKNRKRELIAEARANSKERFEEVTNPQSSVTFEEQGKAMLAEMRGRLRNPTADSTLENLDGHMRNHLNPILGAYPVSQIFNPELKVVAHNLAEKGYAPSTIREVISTAKQVIASAIDPRTGEALHPRTWKALLIDLPVVDPDKQNTPDFDRKTLTGLAAYGNRRMRMLFTVGAATGLRIAELLGIEIDQHISPDFRTITIRQQAGRGKVLDRVKKRASYREVDLHPDIAALLRQFVGERKKGFLFATCTGKPIAYRFVLDHLHLALKALGYTNDLAKSGLAGPHAFRRSRDTYLRNETSCPAGLYKFWLGHAVGQDMSDLYDKIKRNRPMRLDWAERCGYGFDLPQAPAVPAVPADDSEAEAA